jgi:hypothetical protein
LPLSERLPSRPVVVSHVGRATMPGACDGTRGFSVEIPHNVETLHYVETFQPHSMFYFRVTKSFHVNRHQAAGD